MRNGNKSYAHIDEDGFERRENTPWYWKLIALLSSWMILGGYLLLPGLYALDPKLKFSQAVLSVFVVALLTAGYSFTALLCFACRNELFQAESVFLPACTSSLLGLLSIAYNLLSSSAYTFGTSAITGTVVSTTASLTYAVLLLWTHRRIVRIKSKSPSRNLWSNESYYSNFVQNMYPTATSQLQNTHSRSTSAQNVPNVAEEDPINAQMALLLMKNDPRPSPDANSATFQIHLPEDREQAEREARSQELVGTPGPTHSNWTRDRAGSGRPDSLNEQAAWDRWMERGRSVQRDQGDQRSTHSRGLSREERRREIEQGR